MEDNKNPKLRKNGGPGTAVGNALRWLVAQGKTAAVPLLNIAGGITGIKGLNELGSMIRKSDDLSELDKELLLKELEMDMVEMNVVTARHKSDNEHAVTRLVRPVTYTLFTVLFFILVFFDGNVGSFKVDPQYIPVIQSLFGTMTVFYFGSRGLEKVAKTWKGK
jgi:hypothetical protein